MGHFFLNSAPNILRKIFGLILNPYLHLIKQNSVCLIIFGCFPIPLLFNYNYEDFKATVPNPKGWDLKGIAPL